MTPLRARRSTCAGGVRLIVLLAGTGAALKRLSMAVGRPAWFVLAAVLIPIADEFGFFLITPACWTCRSLARSGARNAARGF
jgi:hypothetical protein